MGRKWEQIFHLFKGLAISLKQVKNKLNKEERMGKKLVRKHLCGSFQYKKLRGKKRYRNSKK